MPVAIKRIFIVMIAIVVVAAITAVAIIYHDVNPLDGKLFPQCAFLKLTGYQCPGCGGQRALHYLLNGEFAESFRMNQLLWVGTLYIIVVAMLRIPAIDRRFPLLRYRLTGLWACIAWLVAIIAFWILRNVF